MSRDLEDVRTHMQGIAGLLLTIGETPGCAQSESFVSTMCFLADSLNEMAQDLDDIMSEMLKERASRKR